jgi:hypothetical protein
VKHILSLLFVAIATLAIITSAVVPHHHHRETPCFVTFHHDATESNDGDYCIMESEYYVVSFDYTYFFPVVLCVLIDFFPHDTDVRQEYAEHIPFYKSADISRVNGLRAPPYCLS